MAPFFAAIDTIVDEQDNVRVSAARSLPTLFNEFLQHSSLTLRFPRWSWASEPYMPGRDYRSTREVKSVNGACLMVRADVFRSIGGFDEAFFRYSEGAVCCQIRKAGPEVWYVHTRRIMHEEHHTTVQVLGSVSRIVLRTMRNQHYYFRKHRGKAVAFCLASYDRTAVPISVHIWPKPAIWNAWNMESGP